MVIPTKRIIEVWDCGDDRCVHRTEQVAWRCQQNAQRAWCTVSNREANQLAKLHIRRTIIEAVLQGHSYRSAGALANRFPNSSRSIFREFVRTVFRTLPEEEKLRAPYIELRKSTRSTFLKVIRKHYLVWWNHCQRYLDPPLNSRGPTLNLSIAELDLTVRAITALKEANIQTVGDLIQQTEWNLLKTKHIGRKTMHDIQTFLSLLGLGLQPESHVVLRDRSQ